MPAPKEFAHLQIPLRKIVKATNNFADENLIGQGGFGKVNRGTLSWKGESVDIVARRLHHDYGQGVIEFWTEIMMLARLNHENLVSIVGFCDENGEKIIINKHETMGSLDKHLSSPTLTWMHRLQICVDVAHALRYIHNDVGHDMSVIHRNIKSSKILLDENRKPKLSGFEVSLKNTRARRHRILLAEVIGTLGYVDPMYEKTGFVTHKSDVYSLGVVLFEVMTGRRAFGERVEDLSESTLPSKDHKVYRIITDAIKKWALLCYKGTQQPNSTGETNQNGQRLKQFATQTYDGNLDSEVLSTNSRIFGSKDGFLLHPLFTMKRLDRYIHSPNEEFLAQLAKSHHEEGNLIDIIDPDLHKQMGPQSFDIFSETAYSCLKEQRSQRPNIDQIVIKLEKALELQLKHEILKDRSKVAVEGTSSNHFKGKNLGHLEIPLSDIKLATNNFAETCLIGSGGYGKVYKAKLNLPIEKKNNHEHFKKLTTVAIKRILIREDKHGKEGFAAEIDLLTNCKHPNIVSLLGFCREGSHMILVYEYVPNGSLGDYLGRTDNLTYLTWAQRIKICMDIARGLHYLHTRVEDERRIIHRDIKSDNILLGKNWEAKIADFGLSRFYPEGHEANTHYTDNIAGTYVYLDPEYQNFGKLKRAVDIYSFGVVLFEILSGKIANDPTYVAEDNKGLAPVARRRFKEGTINKMVDPKIMEEVDELNSTLNKGPNQDSLKTFIKIAHQCLSVTQNERPTAEVIMKELEIALSFQENHKDSLQISFEDIEKATQYFTPGNLIGGGGFGKVYKGQLTHANGSSSIIVAKRLDKSQGQGEHEFLTELEILFEYKHENIISLVGYCNRKDEKIIVYEHASNGSLDKHLEDISFTWMKRLKICIDIASGLSFLHGGAQTKEMVIHRDIKSANILVDDDWKAKISDFGLSTIIPIDQEMEYAISKLAGTIGYVDPLYESMGFLTKESDIYSFGVVLFEIMYGRLLVPNTQSYDQQLVTRMLNYIHEGKLETIVLYGIRIQMAPESLSIFLMIVGRCLNNDRKKRPTAEEVLRQLKEALEYQEDYDIWEPKLPKDYKDIIQMSKSPEIYSTQKKKDLCNIFSKGIRLQEDKVWFSLGSNGERNKMISASEFSYISDRSSPEWQSIPESKAMAPKKAALEMTPAAIQRYVDDSIAEGLRKERATVAAITEAATAAETARLAYIKRFQELTVLCPAMVSDNEKLLENFIGGLSQNIQGDVTSFDPQTIEESTRITQILDKVLKGLLKAKCWNDAYLDEKARIYEENGQSQNRDTQSC